MPNWSEEMASFAHKLLEEDEEAIRVLNGLSEDRIKAFRSHLEEMHRLVTGVMKRRGISQMVKLQFSEGDDG